MEICEVIQFLWEHVLYYAPVSTTYKNRRCTPLEYAEFINAHVEICTLHWLSCWFISHTKLLLQKKSYCRHRIA